MDGLIDFHHHARPKVFFDALEESGRHSMGGRPFPPAWTMDKALLLMDEMRIATALLSAPDADLLYKDRTIALKLSRLMNERFAHSIQAHPRRFGAFSSLPMPHLDETFAEIEFAMDKLKLDGVMLSTSYEGEYLGSPLFDPLLFELDRRGCVAFIHPVSPIGISGFKLDFSASLLEYAFDTTRCIANLIRHKVPSRFPKLRFIFSHAGGAAPFLSSRLSLMQSFLTPGRDMRVEEDRAEIERGLRSFYYDTALSAIDPVFDLLGKIVGTDRILFGSDYPQAPDNFISSMSSSVFSSNVFGEVERGNIVRGNGQRLFSRLVKI